MDKRTRQACLLLVLIAGVFFWQKQAPYAAGADSSGYMSFGSLMRAGQLTESPLRMAFAEAKNLDPRIFEPLGFIHRRETDRLSPIYPSGLPLLFAGFDLFMDRETSVSIVLLLVFASAGLLTYLLGRKLGLSGPYALLAQVTIMGSSLTIFMGLMPMSDLLSLCLLSLAVWLAMQIGRGSSWPWLLGFVLGLAVLVRPTNALVFPAIAWILWTRGTLRDRVSVALGGLPALTWLLFLNTALYGSAFTLGYENVGGLLELRHFWPNLRHFAVWLTLLFTPLAVWPFLVAPFLGSDLRSQTRSLLLWALAFGLFYSFYAFSNQNWWFTRFLLPAMPAVVIGSLMVWQEAGRRFLPPRVNPWLPWGLLLLITLSHLIVAEWKGPDEIRRGHIEYERVSQWLASHTEEGDGILCMQFSGAIAYYTDNRPILRWDFLSPESWAIIRNVAAEQDLQLYAALHVSEVAQDEILSSRIRGDWTEMVSLPYATVYRLNPVSTERKSGNL